MNLVHTALELDQALASARASGKKVGFVPTMGALHEGHGALIAAAAKSCDQVVVSVFVNPTQFGPSEDFSRYPRTLEADCVLAKEFGAQIVFAPSAEVIYPQGFNSWIEVEGVSRGLCGEFRPGHFRGVATVVYQLFALVKPDIAFFGQKDLQQCLVLRRMALDLRLPLRLDFQPTVREPDGLALSSRNRYLSIEERQAALVLSRALRAVESAYAKGERNSEALEAIGRTCLDKEKLFSIQYFEVRTLPDLRREEQLHTPAAVAVAGFIGKTRLIDNVLLGTPAIL